MNDNLFSNKSGLTQWHKTTGILKMSTSAKKSVSVNSEGKGKPGREPLSASRKRARQIEHWHRRLAPKFPDIDPHDLDLIIAALLRTPRERMQLMFLKRRKDGRYVF